MKNRWYSKWPVLLFLMAAVVCILLGKRSYVFQVHAESLALKADSLLSVKLKLEEELVQNQATLKELTEQNKKLTEKLLSEKQHRSPHGAVKNDDLKKDLQEMTDIIRNYQSQMKSLILANEKLEKQIENMRDQLP